MREDEEFNYIAGEIDYFLEWLMPLYLIGSVYRKLIK